MLRLTFKDINVGDYIYFIPSSAKTVEEVIFYEIKEKPARGRKSTVFKLGNWEEVRLYNRASISFHKDGAYICNYFDMINKFNISEDVYESR